MVFTHKAWINRPSGLDSSVRWNDGGDLAWIPAFAGMTVETDLDSSVRWNDGGD